LGTFVAFSNPNLQETNASTVVVTPQPVSGFVIPHQAGTMLTAQQVRQYVETHRFWIGPTVTGDAFTILTIQLMTAQQTYQTEQADYLGVPDNTLVYYVKARGPFKPVGLHLHLASGVKLPSTIDSAYEIWDAHSGKLLEEGM